MATTEVTYRREYVSGPILCLTGLGDLYVAVANRGLNTERVYVSSWLEDKPWFESPSDEPVAPNAVRIWKPTIYGLSPELESFGPYLFRIRTTSPNVVPSLSIRERTSTPTGEPADPASGVYYGPGDFAVFDIHTIDSPVPRPPVGPILET